MISRAKLAGMGQAAAANYVSEQEYLSNPAFKHSEWVDGEVTELNVGTKKHGTIQINCGIVLKQYLRSHPEAPQGGYVAAELHCRLVIGGRTVYRLPDVAVVLNDADEHDRYLNRAPDMVVEIRSPEDHIKYLFLKMRDYFANGTRLAWLILPEEETVLVFTPDAQPAAFGLEETLDGVAVLPGLAVPVTSLFA